MNITFLTGTPRRKPKLGDRRTTKKHGEQIRIFKMVKDRAGNLIGYDCTGGRQNYEWVSLDRVLPYFAHLIPKALVS